VVVVDFDEQVVAAGEEMEGGAVGVGGEGAADLVVVDDGAVEADLDAVIGAAAEDGVAGVGGVELGVGVGDGPFDLAQQLAEIDVAAFRSLY
jgi:hypothetical protein